MAKLTRAGGSPSKSAARRADGGAAAVPLQTKLRMGRKGDSYEQEADRVADAVVNHAAPQQVARQAEEQEEPTVQQQPIVGPISRLTQRQAEEREGPVQQQEKEEEPVQAQEEEEEPVQASMGKEEEPVQAQEEEEEPVQAQEEEEEPVQAQEEEEEPVQAQEEEEEPVQAQEEEEEPVQASMEKEEEPVQTRRISTEELRLPNIEEQLASTKGGGFPLDGALRTEMEDKFGDDFSSVRIHTGAAAIELCRRLNAQAFTHGADIYFNDGRFDPFSSDGKRLLAHELTHVVQQGASLRSATAGGGTADGATPGVGTAQRTPLSSGAVQRQPAGGVIQRQNGDGASSNRLSVTRGDFRGAYLDRSSSTPHLQIPRVSIPAVKQRHNRAYGGTDMYDPNQKLLVRRGPRNTNQLGNWRGHSLVVGAAERSTLDVKQRAENVGGVNPQGIYFLRAVRNRDFVIFEREAALKERFKVPNWDRRGHYRRFDVDHIVEHQLHGRDGLDNYELLDSIANSTSGGLLSHQINTRISGALRALREEHPSNSNVPRPSRAQYVRRNFDVQFDLHDFRLPMSSFRGNHLYWTRREIERRQPARRLRPLSGVEVEQLGDQSVVSFFTTQQGGTRLRKPRARRPNWLQGVEYVGWDPVTPTPQAGEVSGTLRVLFFNRAGRRYPIRTQGDSEHRITVRKIDGLAGGFIDREGLTRGMRRILRFSGMSPIEIQEARIDGPQGLFARGRILPTVPFIRDANIEIVITGEEIQLRKTFSTGEVNVPSPFRIDDSSLTVFYSSSRGLGIEGAVQFAIERLGEGRISGSRGTEGGFALEGEFEFDPNLFDRANVAVTYRDNQWGVRGQIQIPRGKVRGIRTATINVSYANQTLEASGDAELDVPGVERGTMSVTVSPQGWSIGGTFNLSSDIPGIRSGSVSATVAKVEGEEGYRLTARGTAVPDIPGIDTSLTVEYDNGALTISAMVRYDRGLLRGQIRAGATNRAVDESGNPTGGPTDNFLFYGGGELTVRITPWLEGTVGVNFRPDGQMIVSGRIGLPNSINVFDRIGIPERELFGISFDIPIFAIPVGPKSIGLKATIRGGLKAYAGIGPGRLEQLELGITYNPDRPQDTHVTGRGRFVIPADAGLKLFVRATVGINAGIGGVDGGLEVAGGLGLEAEAAAGINVDWRPTTGLELRANLSAHVQPKLIFTIDGVISAWVLWYDKEWRWRLADFEYGSNMRFGVRLPITYIQGQPFNISFDDIEFQRPQINAQSFLRGLIRDVKNRRA